MISFEDNQQEFVNEIARKTIEKLRPLAMPTLFAAMLFVLVACLAFMYENDKIEQMENRLLNVEQEVYS